MNFLSPKLIFLHFSRFDFELPFSILQILSQLDLVQVIEGVKVEHENALKENFLFGDMT